MLTHTHISDEVRAAIDAHKPVVALESTLISHGLPYPTNIETALALEESVRAGGATPATIAVLDGKMHVGLGRAELERLASGRDIAKLGTRDLPGALCSETCGATTVSATAFIAASMGIRVFATGGIGGVHRDAAQTLDISADLVELTKTSIIVVCAGAKAILDLPATIEWLETHQVPVVGYKTDEFPAFYSRRTGLPVERAESAGEIARRYRIQRELGMNGGMLVGVPIPAKYEIDISAPIAEAVQYVQAAGIRGKGVTPAILARLAESTGGESIAANIALLTNNAAIAAEIAVEEDGLG